MTEHQRCLMRINAIDAARMKPPSMAKSFGYWWYLSHTKRDFVRNQLKVEKRSQTIAHILRTAALWAVRTYPLTVCGGEGI